jgi:predicted DCC family thiol-disulfide oxidoreductase YuxK
MMSNAPHPIVLYDGICGLCNRFVQFVLRNDRHATFRFASLQSELAVTIRARHHLSPGTLDTVYVVINPGTANELLLARSDAVLFVLNKIGRMARVAGWLAAFIPRSVRDFMYEFFARHRYQIFGRAEKCITYPDYRDRFLDL